MSERHDILLSLELNRFAQQVDQARIHLDGIQAKATEVAKAVQSAFSNLNFNTPAIKQFKKDIDDLNNSIKGLQKNVGTAVQGAQQNLAKGISIPANQVQQNIVSGITQGGQGAKPAAAKAGKTLADEFINTFTTGSKFGFSFAIGNLLSGATIGNALREVSRNIARSFANLFFDKNVKGQLGNLLNGISQTNQAIGQATQTTSKFGQTVSQAVSAGAAQGIFTVGTAANQAAAGLGNAANAGVQASVALGAQTTPAVTGLAAAFTSANIVQAAFGAGAVVLGIVLDKLGDKLLSLANRLAEASGEFTLTFARLNSVITASETSTGRSLGTLEQFRTSIIEISKVTGSTVSDLANLATVFISIDRNGDLASDSLLGLVEAAGFLRPLFRNQIELLTNFRNALQGNFRAINQNIFVARDQADADRRFIEILQEKGKSEQEAIKISKETSQVERNALVVRRAAEPIIAGTVGATDSLTRANLKLDASLQVVLASLGKGAESILARFKFLLADILGVVSALPEPLTKMVGALALIGGVTLDVTGKILKLIGVVALLAVGIRALNVALATNFAIFSGATLGQAIAKFLTFNGTITTTSGLFKALTTFVRGQVTTAFATLSTTLGGLSGIFIGFVKTVLPFILRFSLIIAAVTAAVQGFSQAINDIKNLEFVKTTIKALNDVLDAFSIKLNLSEKAAQIWGVIVSAIAIEVKVAFLALLLVINGIVKGLLALNAISFPKLPDAQLKKLQAASEALDKAVVETGQSIIRTGDAMAEEALDLLGLTSASRRALEAFEALDAEEGRRMKSIDVLNRLNDDQIKLYDNLVDSIKNEVQQLRIRNAELSAPDKASAEQAKLNILIDETVKKMKLSESDAKLVAQRIREEVAEASRLAVSLRGANEQLEAQKQLLNTLLTSIQGLKDSFKGQAADIKESIDAQKEFNAILVTGNQQDIKAGERGLAIRKAVFEVDEQIAKQRRKLEGEQVIKEGREIIIKLPESQRKLVEKKIDDLTRDREIIIRGKIEEFDLTQLNKRLEDIVNTSQKLTDSFADTERNLVQDTQLAKEFVQNLTKGLEFAEEQNELKRKDLDLTNQINELTDKLSLEALTDQERDLISAKRAQLLIDKDILLFLVKQEQAQKNQVITAKAIAEVTASIQDQLRTLEQRQELFKEGVITESIDVTKEKVDILTSALEELLEEERRLERQRIINKNVTAEIEAVKAGIATLKDALLDLNFANAIKSVFTSVSDAIKNVLDEGVKGVLQGTLKISDLFKNMAQNIALSLAKLAADRAFKLINEGLGGIAESLSKIPAIRKLGELLGFKLGTNKPAETIEQQLKASNEALKASVADNVTAVQANTTALQNVAATLKSGVITSAPKAATPDTDVNIKLAEQSRVRETQAALEKAIKDVQAQRDAIENFRKAVEAKLPAEVPVDVQATLDTKVKDTLAKTVAGIELPALQVSAQVQAELSDKVKSTLQEAISQIQLPTLSVPAEVVVEITEKIWGPLQQFLDTIDIPALQVPAVIQQGVHDKIRESLQLIIDSIQLPTLQVSAELQENIAEKLRVSINEAIALVQVPVLDVSPEVQTDVENKLKVALDEAVRRVELPTLELATNVQTDINEQVKGAVQRVLDQVNLPTLEISTDIQTDIQQQLKAAIEQITEQVQLPTLEISADIKTDISQKLKSAIDQAINTIEIPVLQVNPEVQTNIQSQLQEAVERTINAIELPILELSPEIQSDIAAQIKTALQQSMDQVQLPTLTVPVEVLTQVNENIQSVLQRAVSEVKVPTLEVPAIIQANINDQLKAALDRAVANFQLPTLDVSAEIQTDIATKLKTALDEAVAETRLPVLDISPEIKSNIGVQLKALIDEAVQEVQIPVLQVPANVQTDINTQIQDAISRVLNSVELPTLEITTDIQTDINQKLKAALDRVTERVELPTLEISTNIQTDIERQLKESLDQAIRMITPPVIEVPSELQFHIQEQLQSSLEQAVNGIELPSLQIPATLGANVTDKIKASLEQAMSVLQMPVLQLSPEVQAGISRQIQTSLEQTVNQISLPTLVIPAELQNNISDSLKASLEEAFRQVQPTLLVSPEIQANISQQLQSVLDQAVSQISVKIPELEQELILPEISTFQVVADIFKSATDSFQASATQFQNFIISTFQASLTSFASSLQSGVSTLQTSASTYNSTTTFLQSVVNAFQIAVGQFQIAVNSITGAADTTTRFEPEPAPVTPAAELVLTPGFETAVTLFQTAVTLFQSAVIAFQNAVNRQPTGGGAPAPGSAPAPAPAGTTLPGAANTIFDQTFGFITSKIGQLGTLIPGEFGKVFNLLMPALQPLISQLGTFLKTGLGSIFTSAGPTVLQDAKIVETTLTDGFDHIFQSASSTVTSSSSGLLGTITGSLNSIFGSLSTGFSSLFSNLGSLISSGLSSLTSGLGSGLGSIFGGIGSLFGFAKGGLVEDDKKIPRISSQKEDSRLAAVTPGEFIATPEAVKFWGTDFFESLNNLTIPQDFLSGLESMAPTQALAGIPTPEAAPAIEMPEQPPPVILVEVHNNGPRLDPAKFGLQEKDVTRVVTTQLQRGGPIQSAAREDQKRNRN